MILFEKHRSKHEIKLHHGLKKASLTLLFRKCGFWILNFSTPGPTFGGGLHAVETVVEFIILCSDHWPAARTFRGVPLPESPSHLCSCTARPVSFDRDAVTVTLMSCCSGSTRSWTRQNSRTWTTRRGPSTRASGPALTCAWRWGCNSKRACRD